ncbi:hypothetical protein BC943DRAFT_356432 [Umbelopsis sp. AD052]|nr:hypothetical protein BC943DRAFT_356432 [Umbelopsis sp. AD052]
MDQQKYEPLDETPSRANMQVTSEDAHDSVSEHDINAIDHEQNQRLSHALVYSQHEDLSSDQPEDQSRHSHGELGQDNHNVADESIDIESDTKDEISNSCNDLLHLETKSVASFESDSMPTYPQGDDIDFHEGVATTVERRSSEVQEGLSIQEVDAARKVNVLSNGIQDDMIITTRSSESSLSQSSSKTLIGKPKTMLYSNKSTPYTSVISGLSTPAKISHSNTHHYLPATEGADQVVIDVKHEIIDPDFDTSLQEKRRPVNKRGVCNLMTIFIILAIIVFMFAGYPLSLYISKQLHPNDSNPSYSAN